MKKIPTIFKRNPDRMQDVLDEINPECQWVFDGEGTATRKTDGTCCLIKDGKLFKRYDAKHGKTPPEGFIPAQDPDPNTGHWPGWLLVGDAPEDKYFREGWENTKAKFYDWPGETEGTFELCGPKINGNPEQESEHSLIRHGWGGTEGSRIFSSPRTFEGLKEWFVGKDIEGIVYHHTDGRMAKIKAKDFGIKRVKDAS